MAKIAACYQLNPSNLADKCREGVGLHGRVQLCARRLGPEIEIMYIQVMVRHG